MANVALSVRDIAVFRGERCLLNSVSLDVGDGDLVHFVGPNGCGKTSLLRILAGLASSARGTVLWQGEALSQQRGLFQQQMAWLGHRPGLKPELTLGENLFFDNALRRRLGDRELQQIVSGLGLDGRLQVRAGALSAGQQRRAALARVLMSQAPLWLLDEPLTNLDTSGRELVLEAMQRQAANGGAVVFAAHADVHIPGHSLRRLEWQSDDV